VDTGGPLFIREARRAFPSGDRGVELLLRHGTVTVHGRRGGGTVAIALLEPAVRRVLEGFKHPLGMRHPDAPTRVGSRDEAAELHAVTDSDVGPATSVRADDVAAVLHIHLKGA